VTNEQPSNTPLLKLTGVSKEFSKGTNTISVLENADFSMQAGESAAIVGPSGCGKSTLLNLIGTLDQPTSGTIELDGENANALSPNELAVFRNQRIGFIFQLHHLLPQCSVLENVLVPTLINKSNDGVKERAEQLLDRVGLSHRLTHLPGELSGGECQRVAVVRALINQPKILLADEPTGSLSQKGANELTDLLLDLNREENLAMIVVTHSTEVAQKMSKLYELNQGKLIEQTGSR
jgi:ABC-type lipoprotein export system ATPase subunit